MRYGWMPLPFVCQRFGEGSAAVSARRLRGSWITVMHRTTCTRFGAALALGLLISALSGGSIVAAGSAASYRGSIHPDQCLRVAASIGPTACTELNSITTLSSSTNPSRFGQPVTFTATITPDLKPTIHPTGAPIPTGTVDFTKGSRTLCAAVALDGTGAATCTYDGLVVGSHSVTATYGGDQEYGGSNDTLDQVVKKAGTHSIIGSSDRNSVVGESVTLSAFVFTARPGGGIPTGTFQFTIDGSTFMQPVALGADGRAFLPPLVFSKVGNHLVGGTYLGDANHRQSKPVRLLQIVGAAGASNPR
jgi:hypothetical protein